MKLTLDELPHESEGEYLLTNKMMESRGVTTYDVIYLLGKKSRNRARALNITHRYTDDGVIFRWEFVNSGK